MRTLRGALVGYGFIAENGHLPAYRAAMRSGLPLEIVAIAESCPERRRKAERDFPTLRVYDDYQTLFACEAESLDFVDVTTPPYVHAEVVHAAFDRGLHALCEKPMATSCTDAASMVAHARRNERVLYPCHNYKHAPVVRAVREVLNAETIGDVHLVTLQTFRNTHARGVSEWRPDWRRERRYSGGGIGMDHGAHTFYLAFDWLRGYPTAITAKSTTLGDWDTEDNLSCTITFPHGVANAHLSWTAGIRRVIYTLHGTQGAIRVEDDDVEVNVADRARDGRVVWSSERRQVASHWMDASHVAWFASLLSDFVVAIERREYVSKETIDGLRSIELIEAAYASASRRSIELPLGDAARLPVSEAAQVAAE
jgi:myo-inositol 2-dehydrogenase / D-chiro-inositol 1-dehydrogenase